MARRAHLTIVCLLRERLLRVDCQRSGECTPADVIEQPPVDPASGLRALLSLRRPATRVLILHDDLWTQTVDLAEAAVVGLTHADLRRAIAHELEPVSGIAATNTRIGVCEAGLARHGRRTFWVCQLLADLAGKLEHEVLAAGARLAGIAPTCGTGLVGVLEPGELRVEAWENATFCGSPESPERIIAGRTGQRYWTQAVEQWLALHGEALVHWSGNVRPAIATPAAADTTDLGPVPALRDADSTAQWLNAAAPLLLTCYADYLPIIGPAPHASRVRPAMVTLLLTLIVTVLLWFDDHNQKQQLATQHTHLEALRQQRQRREQGQKHDAAQLAQKQDILAANDADAANLAATEALWQQQRAMIPKLLQAIASVRPRGVQLRSVRAGGTGATEVAGIGTDPKAIDDFTAALATLLRASGWDVTPAHSHEQPLENGRSYHEFVTTITPAVPTVATPAPKPRRRAS